MANEEVRRMKRRLGIAEEALRIKKERLEDAVQEYDEEQKTFTIFSKRLEEKWEQRFDAVAALARASGVRSEDIEAARKQEWRAANAASNVAVPAEEIAAPEPSARSQRGAWLAQVRAEAEAKAAAAEAEAEAARISKQQQQQPISHGDCLPQFRTFARREQAAQAGRGPRTGRGGARAAAGTPAACRLIKQNVSLSVYSLSRL